MAERVSMPSVLIVGSGPAGLFAACELKRHGVMPRIVEKRLAPHHETRGTALQPAVLDIVERAGLIEPFLNAGVHIKHSELMGPGMRPIMNADFGGVGCRYEFQCSQPQWRTEQILRDHLAARGVKVEYGAEVTAIEPGPETLRVTLDVGGRTEVATPHYLLGAGGAHDITRHSMNEHLVGETYSGRYVVADVKLGLAIPPETARIVIGAGGFVLFAPLPDSRWLIFVSRDPADARDDPPTAAELAAMVNALVGADVGLSDLRWVSYFKMHRREAESLGDGRRFLLGDAGHMSSPLGGEGINAAFMDAADIAWKLALVVRGAAKPSLLASYAIERGMADRHALEVSNDIHGHITALVAAYRDGGGTETRAVDRGRNRCGGAQTVDARRFLCREPARRAGGSDRRRARTGPSLSRYPPAQGRTPLPHRVRRGAGFGEDARALGRPGHNDRRVSRRVRRGEGRRARRRRRPRPAGWLHRLPRRPRRRDDDGRARRASRELSHSRRGMKTRIGLTLAAVVFIADAALALERPAPPQVEFGDLYADVELQRIFPDSKEFADATAKSPPDDILALYRAERPLTPEALKRFVVEHFTLPAEPAASVVASGPAPIRQHIDELWPILTRDTPTAPPYSSLLPLPRAYVVPGGRFRELYYWDSYFTMLGLAESGRSDLLEDMVQNFAASHRRLRPHPERDAVLLPHPLAAAVLLRHGRAARSGRLCGG